MRRENNHPLIRRPDRNDGLELAFGISIAVLLAGLGVFFLAPTLAWPLVNVAIFGLPAFWVVVVVREMIRFAVAAGFGFELYGIQWGCGRSLGRRRWGNFHHRFSPIPLGADSRYASSQPQNHRLARWSMRVAPLAAQGIWAALTIAGGSLSVESLSDGFSPLATLHLANLVLLAIHSLVPFELQSGLISDLRLLTVLSFANVEDDRVARATALTMRIEFHLEEGDIANGNRELHDAIAQLGREPMLIHLEDRFERIDHAPDPASAAYADAVCDPFDHPWAAWDRDTRPLSIFERALKNTLRFAPIAIAITLASIFGHDSLIRTSHNRWVDEALTIAVGQNAERCHQHLSTYEDRRTRLALISAIPRPLQVKELGARAALFACAGDFERAVRDQSLAVEIADAHRKQELVDLAPDAPERVEAERSHSSELRQLGAWHAANGAYRNALRTMQRAQDELSDALSLATASPPSSQRDRALSTFVSERQELARTRHQILALMGVRG